MCPCSFQMSAIVCRFEKLSKFTSHVRHRGLTQKCLQTPDLELKKLVYLYLINYAKSQPDLAIMAVNTFVKVAPVISPQLIGLLRAQHQWLKHGLALTEQRCVES